MNAVVFVITFVVVFIFGMLIGAALIAYAATKPHTGGGDNAITDD